MMYYFSIMRANPGGQLDPDEIVGRDLLIQRIWRVLEGRSIYMNDCRRIGKTVILGMMKERPPQGWVVSKCDLESFRTAEEFATGIVKHSLELLGAKEKTFLRLESFLGIFKGAEIGGVIKLPDGQPAPWKELLRRVFLDLEKNMEESGQRVVFLWDEVPFLLDKVIKNESPEVAAEILDVIRSLTQECRRVRVVLTGSVGLHHVLNQLRHKAQYSGQPLNHMEFIAPGPLSEKDARSLARALLEGEELNCDDLEACAKSLADGCGHVAFYIQKLVSRLANQPDLETLTPALINATLQQEITSVNSGWDLKHYRTRIPLYYGEGEEALVLRILDCIAAREATDFAMIDKEVRSQGAKKSAEHLRKLLELLEQDFYIHRDDKGRYGFRISVIRRWWKTDRNLPE